MKKFARHPRMVRLGSALFSLYLRIVYLTQRWTIEGLDHARSVWADRSNGALLLLWHQDIPMAAKTWRPREEAQAMRVLISRSTDGEFITQVMDDFGYEAIRGSRRRENSVGDKGGAAALRDLVKWVRDGGAAAITPDGPKGPPRIMGEGPATAARLSGAPVLMAGMACKPCFRIRSWDRTVFPLPFGKAAIVYHPVLYASRGDDIAVLTKDWTDKLNAMTARAEALVA